MKPFTQALRRVHRQTLPDSLVEPGQCQALWIPQESAIALLPACVCEGGWGVGIKQAIAMQMPEPGSVCFVLQQPEAKMQWGRGY